MTRVIILADAAEDIEAARDLYETQELGVGEYCADSLLADIESLGLFGGIHPQHFEFHRMLASRSHSGFTIKNTAPTSRFSLCSICGAIQTGFVKNQGNALYKSTLNGDALPLRFNASTPVRHGG